MDAKYFKTNLQMQEGSLSTECGSEVTFYHRQLDQSSQQPIVVLIHGYPQSSYMWRHIIPLLPDNIPLFVPDIPGYGRSSPSTKGHDKRTIGRAILEALRQQLGDAQERSIVVIGHDRGARLCHRLTVDGPQKFGNFVITGAILLDIVPTVVQFQSFADSKAAAGQFHWPFLANVDFATEIITAQGGGKFCTYLINRWAGSGQRCLQSLNSDDSATIYANYFENESVIRATCEDYKAGANEDVDEQKSDQDENLKIACRTLVIFSADYLGSRYDLKAVWSKWLTDPSLLQVTGISDCGHFIAEESPEITADCISQFLLKAH